MFNNIWRKLPFGAKIPKFQEKRNMHTHGVRWSDVYRRSQRRLRCSYWGCERARCRRRLNQMVASNPIPPEITSHLAKNRLWTTYTLLPLFSSVANGGIRLHLNVQHNVVCSLFSPFVVFTFTYLIQTDKEDKLDDCENRKCHVDVICNFFIYSYLLAWLW